MKIRLSAIRFFIKQCLKLDIDMKDVCRLRDGKININPHHSFTKEELDEIFAIAKKHSPKYHAMIRLLYDEAARIQDVIGVPFKDILSVKPNKNGNRMITLPPKKTASERVVKIRPITYEAV